MPAAVSRDGPAGVSGASGPTITASTSCTMGAGGQPPSSAERLADGSLRYTERFDWHGNHAATIRGGTATTVWWQPDAWDVRVDTTYLSTAPNSFLGGAAPGWHVDIHRAKNEPRGANLDRRKDGREDNTRCVVGGEASAPGTGTMRMQYQGVASARLRNPMLIADGKPGVVSFFASRFHTTAHWLEVAITPAERVVGGEMTAVSGDFDGDISSQETAYCDNRPLNAANPGRGVCSTGNGPGHRRAADSINVIFNSPDDNPSDSPADVPSTATEPAGWRLQVQAIKLINSASPSGYGEHFVRKIANLRQLLKVHPSEAFATFGDLPQSGLATAEDRLAHWRLEFHPGRIDVFVQLADINPAVIENFDNNITKFDGIDYWKMSSLPVSIPWKEVHVHLIGATYQADHHPWRPSVGSVLYPTGGSPWLGMTRELHWRDVIVEPVRYQRVSVAPQDGITGIQGRRDGLMAFDVRDTQRFGNADFTFNGQAVTIPQPNQSRYLAHGQMLFGTDYEYARTPPAPDVKDGDVVRLKVTLSAEQAAASTARIVYDARHYNAGAPGSESTGYATLFVNGTAIPDRMSPAEVVKLRVPSYHPRRQAWDHNDFIHTSNDIPMRVTVNGSERAVFKAGENEILLRFRGHVQLDRLQFEFTH